jgi:hypothetical protein
MSTSRMYVSNFEAHCMTNRDVAQLDSVAVWLVMSSIAICSRAETPTVVKLPTATSVEPSGVTSILATWETPLLCRPVNGMFTPRANAPVAGSTAARPLRDDPFTPVNAPATNSRLSARTRSSTSEPAVIDAANPLTMAPLASRATSRGLGVPLTVEKVPPTNRFVPSVARVWTSPSSSGLNDFEIAPVVRSNAKRYWRG